MGETEHPLKALIFNSDFIALIWPGRQYMGKTLLLQILALILASFDLSWFFLEPQFPGDILPQTFSSDCNGCIDLALMAIFNYCQCLLEFLALILPGKNI